MQVSKAHSTITTATVLLFPTRGFVSILLYRL